MFVRRDGTSTTRYLTVRIGLFFLGAGIWVAGVLGENRAWTGAAMGVILAALILGTIARKRDGAEGGEDVEDDGEDATGESDFLDD